MNVLNGGDFLSGFASGAVSSLLSSGFEELSGSLKMSEGLTKVGMIAVGGLSGGLSSVIAGGNFWDGMRQGLITAGLNHVFHMGKDGKTKRVGDEGGDKIDYMVDDEGNVLDARRVHIIKSEVQQPSEGYGERVERVSGAISPDYTVELSLVAVGVLGRVVGFVKSLFGVVSAIRGGEPSFNFSAKATKHMADKDRAVPVQILEQAIKSTKGMPDPRGSRALMHTTEMFKNGKAYNLEVLYDNATNSIWHFKYWPK